MQGLAKDMLGVADNLSRCLAPSASPDVASLREGVSLTERALQGALEQRGVTRLDPPVGEPFDPNLSAATAPARTWAWSEWEGAR